MGRKGRILRRLLGCIFAGFLACALSFGAARAVTCPSGQIDLDGTCVTGKFAVKTTNLEANDTFQFSMSASGTFTVDCGTDGVLSSSADDVSGNTITRTGILPAIYTCTYSTGGIKTITFDGTATGYNSYNWASAINFGRAYSNLNSYTDLTPAKIASVSGNLSEIFPYISGNTQDGAQPRFNLSFSNAHNLTTLPATLFSGYTTGAAHMFKSTFQSCTGLTSIPAGLFSNITTGAPYMFIGTFQNCTGLTSIPAGLFSGITTGAGYMFQYTFNNCTSLTSIPAGLFSGITTAAEWMFSLTFTGCINLAGYIPPSAFAGLIANSSPTANYMWGDIFAYTKLATSCPCGTKQYITGYEGSDSSNTWNGKVSCEPDLDADWSSCTSCESGKTQVVTPGVGVTCAVPPVSQITLNTTGADTGATPSAVYLKFNTGWYSDSSATNAITGLTTLPTKSGKVFAGFYTGENGTGIRVIDEYGNLLTTNAALKFADTATTVYAHFANGYNITYEMNSGTNYSGAPATYTYGTGATISGVPTKTNNVFAGWCTDSELTTCAMSQTIGTDATGAKTFYAKWTECTACAATNATCSLSVENNTCTYTTACNTGYGNIQNDSAYNASCSANTYTCVAGKYLRASDATCQDCPAGSYCTGITNATYTGSDLGIDTCPTDYTSDTGTTAQSLCYKSCTTSDVPHSTSVTGHFYYGETQQSNSCEPTSTNGCDTGYHYVGSVPDLTAIIGETAAIQTGYKAHSGNSSNASTYGLTEAGTWAVNYGTDLGIVRGNSQCMNGQQCYCQLTGYNSDANNKTATGQSLSAPWVFRYNYNDRPSGFCSSVCADSCSGQGIGSTSYNALTFRTSIFESLGTPGPASCAADVYNITYTMNDGTNYENAPATYTYGTGVTINGVPTKAGNVFAGWCTDNELTTCDSTQTIGTNATGDKTFYAKWTECPSGYENSDVGATAQNQCYHTCTTADIEHSTAVTGVDYYGDDKNTCEATACQNGYIPTYNLAGSDVAYSAVQTEAMCSDENHETVGGQTCWCRATEVVDTNTGTSTPVSSQWVFTNTGSNSMCNGISASYCKQDCDFFLEKSSSFRSRLYDAAVSACIPETYSITYENLTGATNYANAPTTYTYGTGVTISGTPTKSNHVFAGWCTDSGLTTCAMSQTIGTNATGDKTFYAKWAPETYSITYTMNGGTNYENAPETYTYGTGATINGTPTKSNHVFAGWCTDSGLTTCAMSKTIGTNATGDKTFYAKWTECTACATTNASCELSVENNTCTYTTACESGYGNIQNNGEYNASCSLASYDITYTMNGGTNYENAPATYTYGTGATIDGVPTKSGYTFAGWCTDSELTTCADTQTIGTDATGDKAFYAKWAECTACAATNATCSLSVENNTCTYTTACNTGYGNIQNDGEYNASCSALTMYNITYVMNDGTNYNTAPATYYGSVGATINGTPTKSGYAFAGWCTDSALENCAITQKIGTSATGDKTFYAKWAEITAKFSLTTTSVSSFSFKISASGGFYVNCGDGGTLTSSANDVVSGNTIVRSNTTMATYTCTWESAGAHTIEFDGNATGYSDITSNANGAAISFNTQTNTGNAYSNDVASISGSLGAIFPTLGDSNGKKPMFFGTFKQCRSLTSIPAGLFSGVTGTRASMFRETFDRCSSLVNVPESLFSEISGIGRDSLFRSTFNETAMTSVPENLFAGVTGSGNNMFRYLFGNVTTLSGYIPPSTFAGLIANGSPTTDNMWDSAFIGTNLATSCDGFPNTEQYITHYEGEGKNTWDGKVSCQSTLTYNVTYDCDGGTGTAPTDSTDYAPNATVTTLANTCTPPAHKLFDKWSCGGNDVAAGGTFTITEDTTCTAQYINALLVTYDCDGGTGTVPTDSTDYAPNATVTTLANTCTPPAHKLFDKWSCGGNDIAVGGTFTITANTTCTAQYVDTFTVSYDCDGGTGNVPLDNTEYVSGETVTTLANTCTPPAHKLFDKWSCGGNDVAVGGTFTITANTTCTAQYVDTFTVSYNCDGGTGNAPVDNTDYVSGGTVTTLANTCTPPTDEYFTKWSCGGNDVAAGGTFTITANTTCTAQYGTSFYVSYLCGDGTGNAPVDSTSYLPGATVTTATTANTACVRNGYTFSGWSCDGNAIAAGGTFTLTDSTVCTAQYTQCAACATSNASCAVSTVNNVCTYTTACDSGYTNIQNNGQPDASCVLASSCTGATYEDNNVCVACPYNYGYNTENGKVAITQCQAHCAGGTTMANYTPLEYLENSSDTVDDAPYIDTGYYVTSNIVRVELGMGTAVTRTDTSDYGNFFGNQSLQKKENNVIVVPNAGFSSSYKNKILGLWHQSNSKKLSLSNFSPFTKDVQYDLVYTINDTARSFTVSSNGTQLNTNNDTDAGPSSNAYATFKVFSNGGSSTDNGIITVTAGDKIFRRGRVYYLKLWDNGNLVLDLIPARRNSDNELGFYNNVNGEFYTNVGTKPFTAGATRGTFAGGVCANVGDGYYIAESTVNYGSAAPSANQCPDNAATNKQNASSILECEGFACPTGQYYDETAGECTACTACAAVNATCELSVVNNVCTYTTTCNAGYGNIQNNGAYNASCSATECTGATYMDNGVCTACPTGYDYNTTAGKTAITQCQIHCNGGSYIAAANDATCSNVGVGYWAAESTINYGSVGARTACSGELTTVGYGHGADEANDCGHVLHVGNGTLYTRQNKITTPSLNFRTAGGDVFYLSLSTTNHNLSRMHTQYQGVKYTAYDDSLINGERTFDVNNN